ncbi:MAG: hypothetical protein R8K20_11610 [Gallionellaceae bacterium]
MNSARKVPVTQESARLAIETFAKPLKTLRENFDAGQLKGAHKKAAIQGLDNAIHYLRLTYAVIDHAESEDFAKKTDGPTIEATLAAL